MTTYLGGRRRLHPDAQGTNLTLANDLIALGGISVGNDDNPLPGQIKIGVAGGGAGYITGYDGAYLAVHIDGTELFFDISGAEALKLLSTGHLRLRNNKMYKARNAADNADLDLIGTNSSNAILLGSGLTGVAKLLSSVLSAATIVNADVSASADIAMNKLQPYEFHAYNSSTDANVTGDSTPYTVEFNSEVWASAQYDGVATFTAPVTGVYAFEANVLFAEVAAGHNNGLIELVTSNRTYRGDQIHLGNVRANGDVAVLAICVQAADMDANDTAQIRVTVGGSTKSMDVFGAASPITHFSGRQVA